MRFRGRGWAAERAMGILAGLLGAAPALIAQSPSTAGNAPGQCAQSGEVRACPGGAPVYVQREIKDPHSGTRWLIIRNAQHPAGPALITAERENTKPGPSSITGNRAPSAVIHGGDHVVVEEHTPVAESYLDGVALGAAIAGTAFDVRLKIGGKVVRAVAMAPGRAALMPSRGAKK